MERGIFPQVEGIGGIIAADIPFFSQVRNYLQILVIFHQSAENSSDDIAGAVFGQGRVQGNDISCREEK